MSLFPDFTSMFSVGNTISQSSNTKPDDVFNTKNALAQTGYYKVPDFGITDTPDMGMIDGLKGFQQDNGLKVDGVMKPGGPTESKIGETLANTDLLAKKEPVKPKVPKIDPLTGLPEVKMPKLKKPTADLWKQVPATPKPKVNPWFQSPKVKPLPDEDHSSNTRALDGMLHYSNNGSLPSLFANTLKGGDEKAVNEFANFMQQLNVRKPERVESFDKDVMSQLPDTARKAILALAENQGVTPTISPQETGQKGMSFERVAQLQKQYEQDPNIFQKNEAVAGAETEQEEKRPEDDLDRDCKKIITELDNLKRKIDESDAARTEATKKMTEIGKNSQTLQKNIKNALSSLVPTRLFKTIVRLMRGQRYENIMELLRGWAKDITDVGHILTNISELSKVDKNIAWWQSQYNMADKRHRRLSTKKNNLWKKGHGKGCKVYGH